VIGSIKNVSHKIGIDRTIALTLVTRIIQATSGIVSIFFIAKYLSVNEQGYYYTFASIIAIQIFFELGLSGIITQYAAHEFAHLSWDREHVLVGDEYYKSRLSSLLKFCVKCFAIIAVILFVVLIIVGFVFFEKYNFSNAVSWKNPWIILCISTSLNLFIDPILAFFDGIGEIKDMSKVRLIQKLINIILLFLFFCLGLKLYSAALASLIAISINYFQIASSKRFRLLKNIWKEKKKETINYYKEIFPFQWRIALSWISGYFIFQLFNPVIFATEGPKAAGQMGMTLNALNGISTLSMSWITTKIPLLSSLISKKDHRQLNAIFNTTVKQLFFINLIAVVFFIIIILVLYQFNVEFVTRFLGVTPLVLLSITIVVNQLIFSWATYLRCHKQEPFLINSVVIGLLCAFSTIVFGRIYGLIGIVLGYAFINVFIGLPWAYNIFKIKKRLWYK
jgi:O-antigen/teichoic acid export membrane protein